MAKGQSTNYPKKGQYEDSPADVRQDKRSARQAGTSVAAFENSAKDRAQDRAGQKRMNASARKR